MEKSLKALSGRRAVWLKRKAAPMLWSVVRLLLLIGISYVILYPLLVKLALVFMEQTDLKDVTVKWIPRHWTFDNIKTVVALVQYVPVLLRTTAYCALLSLLQVITCTLAGCGFARFKFRGRGLLFALVVATLVVPPQTYIITLYIQFQQFDILGLIGLFRQGQGLNLLDTPAPFILLAVTGMGLRSGLYIYVLRQSFRGLPKELEEAAYVDGAGAFRTFLRVLAPNALPTMLVVFILSFVWQWNDTFFTNMFAPSMRMMSQVLAGLRVNIANSLGGWQMSSSAYASSLINTGTLLAVVPIIVLFIVCQRFFIQGVERSGLVG